jgi:SAM-dependent methyltransferase
VTVKRRRRDDEGDLQTQVLDDLAGAVNYRRWLARLALPWLGADPLEVGSGTGDYAEEWLDAVERLTISDAEPDRVAALKRRFADHPRVIVREFLAPSDERGSHSAVVAYNVLEHIEDDVGALRGFAGLVEPGGRIILIVPAFPFAMSRFDREIGHHRRYTRTGLDRVMREAGLRPIVERYVNAPGLILWLIGVKLLRIRPRAGLVLTAWDRAVPIVARLEAVRHPPFGQSVFAVAARATGKRADR